MTALLPLGLAFLMLVVGLRLSWSDFQGLWRKPLAVVLGLVLQMVALPLMAVLIARMLVLPPELALGLLVVAAAPGGITSNFITLLAKGDVALSTTMTLFTSFAACISIPLVLTLGGAPIPGGFGVLAASLGRTGTAVLLVSVVPLLIGLAVHSLRPALAASLGRVLDKIATAVFFGLIIAAFAQNWSAMMEHAREAGLASALLNAGAIAVAFVVGGAAGLPRRQSLAIAIECGLQNVAMAMFVASSVLKDDSLMIPALIYAVVMNISALGLLALGRMWGGAPARSIGGTVHRGA
jgi:BASS family bile acid:Na+ symporter